MPAWGGRWPHCKRWARKRFARRSRAVSQKLDCLVPKLKERGDKKEERNSERLDASFLVQLSNKCICRRFDINSLICAVLCREFVKEDSKTACLLAKQTALSILTTNRKCQPPNHLLTLRITRTTLHILSE